MIEMAALYMKNSIFNKRSIILLVLIICLLFLGIFLVVSSSRPTDLSLWADKENRPGLLFELLQENGSSVVNGRELSHKSPMYGLSKIRVISLLGSPDNSYENVLVYDIGNIDGGLIGDTFIKQNAELHLHFVEDKCTHYSIYT